MDGMGYDPSFQKYAKSNMKRTDFTVFGDFPAMPHYHPIPPHSPETTVKNPDPDPGRRPPWGDSPRLQHHLK